MADSVIARFIDQHFALAVLGAVAGGLLLSAVLGPPVLKLGRWLQGTTDQWTQEQ